MKSRHSEGEAGVEIFPDAVHHLLEVADHGQHGEHRLHEHAILPLAARTQFEVGGIALGGMETGVAQDNHASVDLAHQPLKGMISNMGRGTVPPHHQAILVQQQTEFAPNNPAVVGHAFATDLLRAAAFADGVNEWIRYVSMTPSTVGEAKKTCVQS